MEDTSMPLDHMKTQVSCVASLQCRLGKTGASMWLEGVWTPKLQRDNDRSIMATTHALGTVPKPAMERINKGRTHLRVITIADLADATGKCIHAELLSGKWRAGSDLKWPKAAKPSKKAWSEFRKHVRDAFSTGASPHQSTSGSMELDKELWAWRVVQRSAWFPCYRDGSKLCQRN